MNINFNGANNEIKQEYIEPEVKEDISLIYRGCRKETDLLTSDMECEICLSKKQQKNEDLGDDFNGGICPEHKLSVLYFVCKTHNVDICKECTVLVHNPTTCEVISFKDEIEKKKSNQLNEADDLICIVDGSINHLNDYQITKPISGEFNKNEIIRLSKEMETEISRLTKAMESDIQLGIEANNAVEKNKEIKKILASAREKLKVSTKKNAILVKNYPSLSFTFLHFEGRKVKDFAGAGNPD